MRRNVSMLLLAASVMLSVPLAQGDSPADETRLSLRHELLQMINRDRKHSGLRPVELDAQASVLSDDYCRRQIRSGTSGHFSTDGQTPYMRYSFAGGNDGVSENAAAWSSSDRFSDRALFDMMRQSEEAMMAERPPHDGHRRTLLDPYATHVGIGLAWEHGEFRLTQEFIRRYIDWSTPLPRAAAPGDNVLCAGKPARGFQIDAISVHHEPLPQPMPAFVANRISSYGLPDHRHDYLPRLRTVYHVREDGSYQEDREEYTDGRRGDFSLRTDGSFSFAVPLSEGPGVYTIVVWVRPDGEKAAIAASNISIRATRASEQIVRNGNGSAAVPVAR